MTRQSALSLIALALLSSSVGCASTQSALAAEPTTRTLAVTETGRITASATDADRTSFEATPDQVFAVLAASFADIGIEATVVDAKARRAGNPSLQLTRTLGKTPLSLYLECGTTLLGRRADNDRILLTMSATAAPAASGGTQLVTRVTATARSMSGSSSGSLDCGSTGRLERALQDAVTQRLAKPR